LLILVAAADDDEEEEEEERKDKAPLPFKHELIYPALSSAHSPHRRPS
jgi:hypothetical protein